MRVEAREAAYAEFVAARQTHLRRIAYAVCGDWQRADDLLHSALVRLYVAWPRVWRLGTEEAYVRRLIMRAPVDQAHGPRRAAQAAEAAEAADASDGPSDGNEGPTALFAALQSLPEAQRKAVVLRHWLEVSDEEAAEDLGMSRGSLRSHAERGLASLEGSLTREER
jgi:RNA polymerase sigma factor (sigma-70 family)